MSADSSLKSNIQVAIITLIAAIYAGVTLPSLGRSKVLEQHSSATVNASLQPLNHPATAAHLRQPAAGSDAASTPRGTKANKSNLPARAEIAR